MRPIQFFLVLSTLGFVVLYFRYFRSQTRDRLIALGISVLAVVAILVPDFTTVVANFVGVGRGADLLLYLLALCVTLAFLLMGSRLLAIEGEVTELVRYIALANVQRPEDSERRPRLPKPPDETPAAGGTPDISP